MKRRGLTMVDYRPTLSLLVGAKPPTGSFGAPLNEFNKQNWEVDDPAREGDP
jgi:hypothetical protein